jgi:secreted trypsin-like serine protease
MSFIIAILAAAVCFATPVVSQAKCGVPAIKPDVTTNIVGGKDAIPYSWPWQAALHYKRNGGRGSFNAGGTLISKQWVMASAKTVLWSNETNIVVTLGVFNITNRNEPGQRIVNVTQLVLHPKFNDAWDSWDVALLKLSEPVEFTDHISPICLPATQGEALPAEGTSIFLTGWGYTEQAGYYSDTLKQVSVPIVSQDKCNKNWGTLFDAEVNFCTGLDEGGKEACYADGGGPVQIADAAGTWKQVGITSAFSGCAEKNNWGLKSKVSAYLDFIKQHVTDLP